MKKFTAAVAASSLLLSGCATLEDHPVASSIVGAVVGAAIAGAVVAREDRDSDPAARFPEARHGHRPPVYLQFPAAHQGTVRCPNGFTSPSGHC